MSRPPRTVSIFCGGRGSSSILRELIRHPGIALNVLVNAYDDGLSTGALRRLIPGMLGPSDFRKNLSYLLELHSKQQFDLVRVLEFRLPAGFPEAALVDFADHLRRVPRRSAAHGRVPAPLVALTAGLDATLDDKVAEKLGGYLATFARYRREHGGPFDFSDVALGNLLFAGAYLQNDRSFNRAVRDLARTMGCQANLINVSRGENRTLVALKADGEYLDCEARIVGPQSAAPIVGLYLLERPLAGEERRAFTALAVDGKQRFLEARDAPVALSPEARVAIEGADVLVYGPGTQHSSLLPSYKTAGLRDALAASRAPVKALFVNLRHDHDIQGLGATDIVDAALRHLGDPDNAGRVVTHVLVSSSAADPGIESVGAATVLAPADVASTAPALPDPAPASWRGAAWIALDLENRGAPGIHNGHHAVAAVLSLLGRAQGTEREELDLYVDLHERSLAAHLLVQEFAELDWARRYSRVRLCINAAALPQARLAPPLELRASEHRGLFSEVDVFRDWLLHGTSQYLATLTGDGEFRLQDILAAQQLLDESSFGAIFGSRSQSRLQFASALEHAYGESKPLLYFTAVGGYVFSALFALRFRVTLSDPFTGFRLYRRAAFKDLGGFSRARVSVPSHISRYLMASSVEVAEMPVAYRTFQGFTNGRTRLVRGLRNAIGLFV